MKKRVGGDGTSHSGEIRPGAYAGDGAASISQMHSPVAEQRQFGPLQT